MNLVRPKVTTIAIQPPMRTLTQYLINISSGEENRILEQLQKMEERDSKIKCLREEGNDDSDK